MEYENIWNDQEVLEQAASLLQPGEADLMLDLACGKGDTTTFFAPRVKSVIAADMNAYALKKAQAVISEQKELFNVSYREADVEDLPFPAGAFSLVCRQGEFHHFTDLSRAFCEFFRILRWQGRLWVMDGLLPEDPGAAEFSEKLHRCRDTAHTRLYTQAEWLAAIETTDFVVHRVHTFGKRQDFRKWCRAGNLSRAAADGIQEMFFKAAPEIQEFFQVEVFAGEMESFVEPAVFIYAVHPPKPAR